MANLSLADHAMIFDGALPSVRCEALIERFESLEQKEPCAHERRPKRGGPLKKNLAQAQQRACRCASI
jgi:hypothetical protein